MSLFDEKIPIVSDRPHWRVLKTETLIKSPFLQVRLEQVEMPDGRILPKYYILDFTPWVNVVALTPERKLVIVEQYRHGLGEYTIEIPGGAIDPVDQADVLKGGLRELREETGFAPQGAVKVIAKHAPNPSLQSNLVYTVLALDCIPVYKPEPDPYEDIRILTMDLSEVKTKIKEGTLFHSIVLAALAAANSELQIF